MAANSIDNEYNFDILEKQTVKTILAPLFRQISESNLGTVRNEFETLILYRPFLKKCVKNRTEIDPEDVEQYINVKFLKRAAINPNWWQEVNGKKAYIFRTIINAVIDMIRKIPQKTFSYDDPDNEPLQKKLTDDESAVNGSNNNMDLERFRTKLKAIMAGCTDEEREITGLMLDGLSPLEVADTLGKDKEDIKLKCNRIKARLRARAKKDILNKISRQKDQITGK